MRRSIWRWISIYTLALLGATFTLFPILWVLTIAFRPSHEMYASPFRLIPASPTLDNFINVLMNRTVVPAHLEQGFVRSLTVALCTALLAVIIASLAGYALARFSFRWRETYGLCILTTQMMPTVLFLVPLFEIYRRIGLVNTLLGLVLSDLAFSLPFCIWLLRGYFEGISPDLEAAARIDGCSRLQTLWYVILPLTTPALVATGGFAFINAWNEFLFAFILAGEQPLLTVQLYAFSGQYGPEYGNLMAFAILVTLPPILLFVPTQHYLIRGLTAGAVKS